MLHQTSNSRQYVLFWLSLIPLCLSLGSFLFLNYALTGYMTERHNEKNYFNTTCFLNGTITVNEPCKDNICRWPLSSDLCSSTFRLCLKTIYVIVYGTNQNTFTDTRPSWANDDDTDTICYYDKTKSGIVRWDKPKTKEFQIKILFGSLIFISSIILWIFWIYLKKTGPTETMTKNDYHMLTSEL